VKRDVDTQTYDNTAADISSDDVNNNDDLKDLASGETCDPKLNSGQTLEMKIVASNGDMCDSGQ
jgi:3-deoxy-D-arabino-heptulosonate 7-phosphate (DAHP) synthase class II